ncbi:calpain-A-like [Aphidius gifuensis]|uniref:calpain-A-like n=1 Tax=Aphidius gifuensis TaxID=684658 RepID=UPI001CDD8081|nr:calpain-A-like [Aphidius gifuensis]
MNCHCSSMGDRLAINKASTSLQRILSITEFPEIHVENVQLTEYKNGEMIEFQQQDFDDLRERALISNTKFEDDQFSVDSLNASYQLLRPMEIVDNPVFYLPQNNNCFYVRQGGLGDCWFIVGLVHLQYYPNLFKFIVRPYEQTFDLNNYAGIFHFRFWQAGTWVDVVIDDRLPTWEKELVYASSGYPNEFWPALIEKAYAKLLYRSYEKLQGGFSAISMQDLSGGISETHPVGLGPPNILFEIIYHAKTRLTMIGAATNNETDTSQFGLLLGHSYVITGVKKVTGINVNHEFKLLHIYNPHGESSERYFGEIGNLFSEETIRSQLNIKENLWEE